MLSRILAAVCLALLVGVLWLRTEAVSARKDLRTAQSTIEGHQIELRASAAREEALSKAWQVRSRTQAVRKEEIIHETKLDKQALAVAKDWGDEPIPAAVLERLRPAVGERASGSSDGGNP